MSADATTLVRQEWEEGDRRLEAERGDRAPLRAPARAGRGRHRRAAEAGRPDVHARRARRRLPRRRALGARGRRGARAVAGLAARPRARPRRRVPRVPARRRRLPARDRAARSAAAAATPAARRGSWLAALCSRRPSLFALGIALGEALHDNPKPEFNGYNARKRSSREQPWCKKRKLWPDSRGWRTETTASGSRSGRRPGSSASPRARSASGPTRAGCPPSTRPGGHRRYRRSDLEAFLDRSGPGGRPKVGPARPARRRRRQGARARPRQPRVRGLHRP